MVTGQPFMRHKIIITIIHNDINNDDDNTYFSNSSFPAVKQCHQSEGEATKKWTK